MNLDVASLAIHVKLERGRGIFHVHFQLSKNRPASATDNVENTAPILPCYYAIMLLCYYAMLLRYHVAMLLRYYATVLLCYCATMLLCYCATVLRYYVTMLLCYYATMLLCYYVTMLCYCAVLCYCATVLCYCATVLCNKPACSRLCRSRRKNNDNITIQSPHTLVRTGGGAASPPPPSRLRPELTRPDRQTYTVDSQRTNKQPIQYTPT